MQPIEVFAFCSNASGAHGGGAALFAFERFGAAWRQSEGLQGQSYSIDTMSGLRVFKEQAARFMTFARSHTDLRFLVIEVGCGIAGYTPDQVAGFFASPSSNVVLPRLVLCGTGRLRPGRACHRPGRMTEKEVAMDDVVTQSAASPRNSRRQLILAITLSAALLLSIVGTVLLLLFGRDATLVAGIGGSALTGLLIVLAWPNSA